MWVGLGWVWVWGRGGGGERERERGRERGSKYLMHRHPRRGSDVATTVSKGQFRFAGEGVLQL